MNSFRRFFSRFPFLKKSEHGSTEAKKSLKLVRMEPPVPVVKGNKNSKGEKIYHVKGGRFYESLKNVELFTTEEEAQLAGYRKSKQ